MHILILGAGALGSLMGARLSRSKANVALLSRNKEHIQAIQEHGLVIEEMDGSENRFHIPAFSDPAKIDKRPDLVLVLVKSPDTANAVASIEELIAPQTIFLTLQNGLGNWEKIAEIVNSKQILAGVTSQGATFVRAGKIKHGGSGPTYIGTAEDAPDRILKKTVDLLQQAGLEAHESRETNKLIWEKLLINVGINAITAITGVPNGWISQYTQARELAVLAVQEALSIARAKGIYLDEDMTLRVLDVAKATSSNISSMNQDIRQKKTTEIEAINGAILKFGEQTNTAVPINRALTNLVRILEQKNAQGVS